MDPALGAAAGAETSRKSTVREPQHSAGTCSPKLKTEHSTSSSFSPYPLQHRHRLLPDYHQPPQALSFAKPQLEVSSFEALPESKTCLTQSSTGLHDIEATSEKEVFLHPFSFRKPSENADIQSPKKHPYRNNPAPVCFSDEKSLRLCSLNAFASNEGRMAPIALPERMIPVSIHQIFGQDHLLGPGCVLRSLLDCPDLPCLIFQGGPGTGKTILARLIARCALCRFVSFSAEEHAGSNLHAILKDAEEMMKFRQRTLIFVESLSRFRKIEQELLLPAIDDGYVVFIGATSGNPFLEASSALLSRCRVLTLNKLKPEHLLEVMEKAILDTQRGIAASVTGGFGVESITVEKDVLEYLAHASDGNARLALTGLEVAVEIAYDACIRKRKMSHFSTLESDELLDARRRELTAIIQAGRENTRHPDSTSVQKIVSRGMMIAGGTRIGSHKLVLDIDKKRFVATRSETEQRILGPRSISGDAATTVPDCRVAVTMEDAEKAVKRLVPFNKMEENDVLLDAMQNSMRAGDANAAIYWLVRILKSGKMPLDVAKYFIVFASEAVGLADPQALVLAVACYNACHILSTLDCSVHLAQCAAYLSMCSKSVAVQQSMEATKRALNSGSQNERVPLSLWTLGNTRLNKDLSYLPPSLNHRVFLNWPETP